MTEQQNGLVGLINIEIASDQSVEEKCAHPFGFRSIISVEVEEPISDCKGLNFFNLVGMLGEALEKSKQML